MAGARRNWQKPKVLGLERIYLSGRFFPDTASAPTKDAASAVGWTVSRVSTGLFRVTFEDQFPTAVYVSAHLQLASGDDKIAQCAAITLSTTKTLDIRVWDISAAAVADVAADANNSINFQVVFKNTAIPDKGLQV